MEEDVLDFHSSCYLGKHLYLTSFHLHCQPTCAFEFVACELSPLYCFDLASSSLWPLVSPWRTLPSSFLSQDSALAVSFAYKSSYLPLLLPNSLLAGSCFL